MKIIVLDTETTGVGNDDKIIQLAYLVIDEDGSFEIENTFCYTNHPINFHAMATHHITPEMLEGKPQLNETKEFKRLLELNKPENYIVIQNSEFDINMLEKEAISDNDPNIKFKNEMKLIDTFIIAQHLLPNIESHSLQYMRYRLELYKQEKALEEKYNIKLQAHDALGDILVTYLLYSFSDKNIVKRN